MLHMLLQVIQKNHHGSNRWFSPRIHQEISKPHKLAIRIVECVTVYTCGRCISMLMISKFLSQNVLIAVDGHFLSPRDILHQFAPDFLRTRKVQQDG